jgi:pre-mRNA-splicing factor ATP-dependent RNA helicase DHX15/PRP43
MRPEHAASDVRVLAANTVTEIHKSDAPGHILVFLPGQGEISDVSNMLHKTTTGLDIFPLYSSLAAVEQQRALVSAGPNRKCILATNIAETSLTIDNIVYVVDSGLSRQMSYNHRLDMDMLQVQPISQTSARQRTGRAGRTNDGVCYRLYSKDEFDGMAPSTEPAVRRASVHSAVLTLLAAGHSKVIDFD